MKIRHIVHILIRLQSNLLCIIYRIMFKDKQKTNPARLLIYRTAALGDFLFAVPSMVNLRKKFPSAEIMLLTTTTTNYTISKSVQQYAGQTDDFPWIKFVKPSIIDITLCFHSLDIKQMRHQIKPKILSFDPDLTVILPHPGDPAIGLVKKMLFLRLLGVKKNVYGWRMRSNIKLFRSAQYKAGLFEHKVYGPLRAITETRLFPLIADLEIKFPLCIDEKSSLWATNLWREKELCNANVIAIAPGSLQPHKKWPEDKFISLCLKLFEFYDVKVVVIGTINDHELGERIREKLKSRIVNLAGEASISQAAAVLKRCLFLVGNDGGAVHLAAAVDCPVVSLIPGLEFPGAVDPWNYDALSVRQPVPCAPCYSMTFCPKGHNRCMKDIPVDKVFRKCSGLLDNKISLN
jgi:heptosyltransferase-2